MFNELIREPNKSSNEKCINNRDDNEMSFFEYPSHLGHNGMGLNFN